ncbi:MAG: hypothetical protein WCH99_20070 [Verrucomicrobiota bacterium]
MMSSPWQCLEDVPAHSAAAAEWKRHLGDDFSIVGKTFLQRARRKAMSVPCSKVEGCAHALTPRGDGFVGKCKDDDGPGCDDIEVTADDAEVWEVNLKRLGSAVASALKCVAIDEALGVDRTRQVAALGNPPVPILLTVQPDADGYSAVVTQLAARWPKGFVLLAPTNRFCAATAIDMLGRANAGFFDLESILELASNGQLHAPQAGAELFKRHLPEMKNAILESDQAQVWRLFSELVAMGTKGKAPPARVFDLLVFQKLNQTETAGKCKCSLSLISNQVDLIENHFHMSIERLRAFASDLKERQRMVKGDRYAKKKQGAMRDVPGESDDDADSAPKEEYVYESGSSDD